MAATGIESTTRVWNPVTGCDKISPGCGLPRFDGDATGGCYALAMARRLQAMGHPKYQADGAGTGGCCPSCDEPITIAELTSKETRT